MHEYSIVSSLLEVCKEVAMKNQATSVNKVVLKVGRLSGIETHFLINCFDAFKEHTICHDAELVLEVCEVKIHCNDCQKINIITNNTFYCPLCNSGNTSMISGQELLVQSIEVGENNNETL